MQAVARQREHLCGECLCDYVRGKPRNVARTQGLIGRGDSVLAAVSGGAACIVRAAIWPFRNLTQQPCRAMLHCDGARAARHAEQEPAASRGQQGALLLCCSAPVTGPLTKQCGTLQVHYDLAVAFIDESAIPGTSSPAEGAPETAAAVQATLPQDVPFHSAALEDVFQADSSAEQPDRTQLQERLHALWQVCCSVCSLLSQTILAGSDRPAQQLLRA